MLKVLYLAGGFPSPDNPSHGIFNQRAADALKELVNLTVVHYRIFLPGRKVLQIVEDNDYKRVILCVPYFPFFNVWLYGINNAIFRFWSKIFLHRYFMQADLVHASDGNLGVFAAQLKKSYNWKLLVQFIGGDLNQDLPPQMNRPWLKNWLDKIDGISFNSLSLKRAFKQFFGGHPQTKVIYRGVDTQHFSPADSNQSYSKTVFYYLGGLPNYRTFEHGRNTKGGQTLMDAWAIIDRIYPKANIELRFAGPDSDIQMVQEWKKQLRHPIRVRLIGKINPNDIPDFHREGQVALIPSLEEGLPNVSMEAAASGNLIIATEVGGIPEVVENQYNGLLIPPNDSEALAKKIEQVIQNPEMIATLGKNGRTRMEKDFSSITFGSRYVQFYQQILAEN